MTSIPLRKNQDEILQLVKISNSLLVVAKRLCDNQPDYKLRYECELEWAIRENEKVIHSLLQEMGVSK